MSNTKQPRSRTRAKILDRVDADEDLREFVDETKQRLIMLGFIPPPQSSDWKESSAYIQHLGELVFRYIIGFIVIYCFFYQRDSRIR